MRKFFKIALVTLLVLAAGTGTAVYYFMKVKKYDVADKKVDEIIEKQYSIQLPDGTPLPEGVKKDANGNVLVNEKGHYILTDGTTVDPKKWLSESDSNPPGSKGTASANTLPAGKNNGTSDGGKTTAAGTDGKTNATSPNGTQSNNPKAPPVSSAAPSQKATVDTIKKRYAPSFSSLQGQAEGQLGSLISQAKSEYAQKKANGEAINPAYFYQKYTGAASAVEAKTDAAFNTLYDSLVSELKKNNYSSSHAKAFKDSYESAKESRKKALLSKATGG
ncbi:hypothetical protein [Pseudobacillus wudalianchiensis]|uniref:Uncharacterized protein n=1 Tax=Pseudobacillus wudalianchiensis TaxID=1743143 RepID=A0A1B9AYM9_9BACI|nr:hypothetical protein [Bacillus wudalianchiensis]OCA88910.1 hypothetical protein A8F95_05660 [Bacillus wudalianchiensis]